MPLYCCNFKEGESPLNLFNNIEELSITDSVLCEELLINPSAMLVSEEILFFNQYSIKGDSILAFYDTSTGDFRYILGIGRGPNEILGISDLWITEDTLCVVSRNELFGYKISINSLRTGRICLSKMELSSSIVNYMINTVGFNQFIAGNSILASDSEYQFYLYEDTVHVASFGEYPADIPGNSRDKSFALQGPMAFNGSGRTMVHATLFGERLLFYDFSDKKITLNRGYEWSKPLYTPRSTDVDFYVEFEKDTPIGVPWISTDGELFYIPYVGKKIGDRDFSCNRVMVFSEKGEPLKLMCLDRSILMAAITKTKTAKKLYFLCRDAETLEQKIYISEIYE